jgi:hypothetical protein
MASDNGVLLHCFPEAADVDLDSWVALFLERVRVSRTLCGRHIRARAPSGREFDSMERCRRCLAGVEAGHLQR